MSRVLSIDPFSFFLLILLVSYTNTTLGIKIDQIFTLGIVDKI